MLSFTLAQPAYTPRMPDSIDDLGLSSTVITDLILRRAYVAGTSTLSSLSKALKLSTVVVETIFRELRQQQLIEVKGMVGNDYAFTLTNAGRSAAQERYLLSRYAGPAPVPLKQYARAVKCQAARVRADRETLRKALSDLVLTEEFLDRLGPAVVSQNSIFLYGPTGGGKTSVAERLLRVYQDVIVVPHALEVDGQIIQMYDPVVHERIETFAEDLDPRWVVCKRPCVITGGELMPAMLDLRLDEATGIYAAPLQLKANNGILVIDDFGRQLMAPRDLLNRWIVPLDRRVDYLMLRYGVKFQIPFEMLVVFATNLNPRELADEAFLRRIQNKVYVDNVDPDTFASIFDRVARARNLTYPPGSVEYLRDICNARADGQLRACYPADICNILISIATYEGRTPEVNSENLERAAALYFARG
jgi:hypothetical protein